jgi:transcriptional regulator with XRE-family HTH domain
MTSALVIPLSCQKNGGNASGNYFQPIGGSFRNNGRVTDAELRLALASNVRARMEADQALNSHPKLAAKAGIGKSTIGYVLSGSNDATISTVAALARAFGCQPWELLVHDEAAREAAYRRIMGR